MELLLVIDRWLLDLVVICQLVISLVSAVLDLILLVFDLVLVGLLKLGCISVGDFEF